MSRSLKISWATWLIAVFAMALALDTWADTNLPVVCSASVADGRATSACPWASQTLDLASAESLVRSCESGACSAPIWRRYGALGTSAYVEVCLHDRPPGSAVSGGWCDSDDHGWTNMRFVPKAQVATQTSTQPDPEPEPEPTEEGTLSVTPTSGNAPLSVRLSWSVPEVTSCTAAGAWSGTKATSGEETVTLTADATFTLNCSRPEKPEVPGVSTARLTWTAPTQNTDGSTLTNLGGFVIAYGQSASALTQTVAINGATTREYTLNSMAPGAWHFAIKAVNTAGAESALSAVVSKTMSAGTPAVPGVSWSKSVSVDVQEVTVPSPPTELRVVDATAVEVTNGVARTIGVVKVGTLCDSTRKQRIAEFDVYAVPRDAIDFTDVPANKAFLDLYAKCG